MADQEFTVQDHKWTWVETELTGTPPLSGPCIEFFCEDAHPLLQLVMRRPCRGISIKSNADAEALFKQTVDGKCTIEFESRGRFEIDGEKVEAVQLTGKNKGTERFELRGTPLSEYSITDLLTHAGINS